MLKYMYLPINTLFNTRKYINNNFQAIQIIFVNYVALFVSNTKLYVPFKVKPLFLLNYQCKLPLHPPYTLYTYTEYIQLLFKCLKYT